MSTPQPGTLLEYRSKSDVYQNLMLECCFSPTYIVTLLKIDIETVILALWLFRFLIRHVLHLPYHRIRLYSPVSGGVQSINRPQSHL